jgi:hypothetical protein
MISAMVAAHASAGPRLQVVEPNHDFGSVPQGSSVRHDFKLRNTGDAPLEIIDVRPSCGCTTAGEWTRTIKPGETGTLPIQMETAQFAGAIAKTITISSNDPSRPQAVLEVKADVWTPVKVSTPVLVFPALADPNEAVTRSVTIRHQVDGILTISDLRIDKPVFKTELKETVPGKEFELLVSTIPPIPAGTQTARITMKSSNEKMPELVVQAVATLLPPVQVAPTEIILPAAKLAAPEKRYVVVLNHRGHDLQVSDLKTNAAGAELTINPSPDKKQITVTVTFPAGFQVGANAKLAVSGRTNHPTLPTFEVPIAAGNR